MNLLLILIGKFISGLSKALNLGHGSTWPGHIALTLNKNFIRENLEKSSVKIIPIAGTNGKTTTAKLLRTILEKNGNTVFQNESGANLLNGIASTLIQRCTIVGKVKLDYVIFEIDENTLPLVLQELIPDYLILLNLFRDQLDRYGEINSIANKWSSAIKQLSNRTIVVLNADDPQIAFLSQCHPEQSEGSRIFFFGLNNPKLAQKIPQHASDSTYCPKCNTKLDYKTVYYSHVGEWQCKKCKLKRPELDISNSPIYPLPGTYNKYNTLAAFLSAKIIGIKSAQIVSALQKFKPAFGRQEILNINGKSVRIFLSKNPTSFNQSLQTIKELGAKHVIFVLNDRIPDGRDVSWIWDVDFEEYQNDKMYVSVAGDRAYDMALRMKYAFQNQNYNSKIKTYENLEDAIKETIEQLNNDNNDVLYILPTYSAMLEVRKILTGKKIL